MNLQLKNYTLLSLFLLLSFSLTAQQTCRELVWSDEFNGTGAPTSANWTYDTGTGDGGWGNREIQVYTTNSENVRLENGSLIIDAIKNNSQWTSARVKSQGIQSFQYGVIEFRAKLPAGSGTWPALWLLGENISQVGWPACGEIDVMEHVGKDPGKIHGSIHSPSSFGATVNTGSRNISNFDTEFHLYSAEWTPDRITFKIDDQPYYVYAPSPKNSENWPFDAEAFIIMNVAMGGNFGSDPQYESGGQRNGVDPNLTMARMEVDYVRVYQEISSALTVDGDSTVLSGQQGIVYTVSGFNGPFNWSVPEDATIVSGQGTDRITVNWGDTEGPVMATGTGDCGIYTGVLNVRKTLTPVGAILALDDFEDGVFEDKWTLEVGDENTFTLKEENGELMVAYDVSNPRVNPRLVLDLGQPVDLARFSKIKVSARTRNTNRTVSMRIDMFDNKGVETNATPVFRLEPIVDDGEYHTYEYDFSGSWVSSSPNAGALVDSNAIQGLNLYINYGFFGAAGQDTIWFDIIEMADPNQVVSTFDIEEAIPFEIYPNPVKESITITKSTDHKTTFQIELYDLTGQRILTDQYNAYEERKRLSLQDLTPGVYLLTFKNGKNVYTRKIIKE